MLQVELDRIPQYYHRYVNQSSRLPLPAALQERRDVLTNTLSALTPDQWDYAYAPGKWTIKELVLHIIDAERIFSYRALCFARHDATPLPSFEENSYAVNSEANARTPQSLIKELEAVLDATDSLFNNLSADQLNQAGTASENRVYVKGIGYIIAGHALHHLQVMKERYLQPALS